MNLHAGTKNRRGNGWLHTVRRCLRLMREQEEGAALSREEGRLARAARAALTAQQRTYLRLYYAANLNQEQIAMLMGRHLSNVCRCLNRAEDNLERVVRAERTR